MFYLCLLVYTQSSVWIQTDGDVHHVHLASVKGYGLIITLCESWRLIHNLKRLQNTES